MCYSFPAGLSIQIQLPCNGPRLRPLCLVPRVPCAQTDCFINGTIIPSGSPIKDTGDECVSIVCYNGYGMTRITETCTFTGKQNID